MTPLLLQVATNLVKVGVILLLLKCIEYFFPFHRYHLKDQKNQLNTNLFFSLINVIFQNLMIIMFFRFFTNFSFFSPVIDFNQIEKKFSFPMQFLWFEFIAWLVHYFQHRSDFIWSFHLVHHSAKEYEVTNTYRAHPLDGLLIPLFCLSTTLVFKFSFDFVFIYGVASTILSSFFHSNIILPARLERILSWLLVTPRVHRVHHSQELGRNHNFGNLTSLWDIVFRSYVNPFSNSLNISPYGVKGVEDKHANNLKYLLFHPFGKKDS